LQARLNLNPGRRMNQQDVQLTRTARAGYGHDVAEELFGLES
jgi:hypothetical protein